jgi:hypothetical protein
VDKKKMNFQCSYDFGDLILEYLPRHSIGFKIVERTHPNLRTIRIEWENSFDYVVEPTDPEILQFFSGKWKLEWSDAFFPPKTLGQEFKEFISAFTDVSKNIFRSKVLKSAR